MARIEICSIRFRIRGLPQLRSRAQPEVGDPLLRRQHSSFKIRFFLYVFPLYQTIWLVAIELFLM